MSIPALLSSSFTTIFGNRKVNPARLPVPPAVNTETFPLAPTGDSTAVIDVADTTVNELAGTPPNCTPLTFVKSVPVIVITSPAAADVGVNDVTVGGGKYVNPVAVTEPPGVVTVTSPEAPVPTLAESDVIDRVLNDVASTPPKVTDDTPMKLVPVINTVVPDPPTWGEIDVMVGGC